MNEREVMLILLLSNASAAAVVLGILFAWQSVHVPPRAVEIYEYIAGVLLFLGITGLGFGMAIATP